MNLRQAAQQALEMLEELWNLGLEYTSETQHKAAIDDLRAALAEPEHRSPNELLLDELLQNSIKLNKELVRAIKDIQQTVTDEDSAQAVARALLKNMGVNK